MDNVGQQLKTLRQRRGLSQRKLAKLARVSNATVSLIEHGKTDPGHRDGTSRAAHRSASRL